jgi:hypothetical protein
VNPNTIAKAFMLYLGERCSKHTANILFAHNLEFDLGAVLSANTTEIFRFRKPPPVSVTDNGKLLGEIMIYPQKTWFARIKFPNGAYLKVVDSLNFIRGSLHNLSKELNLRHKKETRPEWIGREPKNPYEWKELVRYCGAEIKAEYDLAEYILGIHRKYQVGYSVSISQLSSKVFRKYFLKESIPQAPFPVLKLSEYCIHGGRADCFVPYPTVIPNVKMYDYNSFYPWAMTKIPPTTRGEWVHTDEFRDDYEGFYLASGFVKECRWPVLLKSSQRFIYANNEEVKGIPIVSYELREALRNREIEVEKVEGYIWVPSEGSLNPFKDFVDEFYRLKEAHRDDDSQYLQYKLILNSLYGKTYQALRTTDYEEEPELIWDPDTQSYKRNRILYRAGGLYLPHVGAWITSLCRAKLHEDLHKYEALDCATDSFKTLSDVPTGKSLGELKFVEEGLLLMIRPKLYVMFSNEVAERLAEEGDLREYLKTIDVSSLRVPEDVVKNALHGFWGSVYQLLELYRDKSNSYLARARAIRIKESIRQRKNPRVFETSLRGIRVNWEDEKAPCGYKRKTARKALELCSDQCFNCPYVTF